MKEQKSIPSAPMLIESMRSIGYSFQTALADIIDNSLSAKASTINIYLEVRSEKPSVVFIDNGVGMSVGELEEAMRYGSSNPNDMRNKDDLGRFGLGLKSASMSQCRELVVVSKVGQKINCFSWNLDYVIAKNDWVIQCLDNSEIDQLPLVSELMKFNNGTYVLWRNFDRIESTTNDISKTLEEKMYESIEYLALIFHRFIDDGVKIAINNEQLLKRDPFLKNSKKTQQLRSQKIIIEDSVIKVQPYILPFISKLNEEELELLGNKDSLRSEQGFYIYRNKRLIVWGTWFRIVKKDELGKLSRVQVDIPNTLDYMWSIDIKKSSASIPSSIREKLYTSVKDSISSSKQVMKYRGRKKKETLEIDYAWNIVNKDKIRTYEINLELPLLRIFENSLNKDQLIIFEKLIEDIQDGFPIRDLYNDLSEENNTNFDIKTNEIERAEDFKERIMELTKLGISESDAKQVLIRNEKFFGMKGI